MREALSKFLQTDKLVCANDGKKLESWGYLKLAMWPQYPILSLRWLKQFFGDTMVLRFCNQSCFREFTGKGRLYELETMKA